jgi:hypothetical protein
MVTPLSCRVSRMFRHLLLTEIQRVRNKFSILAAPLPNLLSFPAQGQFRSLDIVQWHPHLKCSGQ